MSGYIKYFENKGKNMSFMVKNDNVLDEYNEIWDKIKKKLNTKFHSMPLYDEKYIKAKVREFSGGIKTNFLGDKIPKENKHYICIACITTDSVKKMEVKNYLQVYLEKCKYRMKTAKMTKFTETKLESDSRSEVESDTELEAKLKPDSDSDSESLISNLNTFCQCFTKHRWLLLKWLLTGFGQVKNLVAILLTLGK